MEVDKETEKQIHELQLLEQNLQNILMQKQVFQLESSEIENALEELENAGEEDVYKIVGQVMIKSAKIAIQKELQQKQEIISLRLKSLDNQEKIISKNSEKLKKEVLAKIQP